MREREQSLTRRRLLGSVAVGSAGLAGCTTLSSDGARPPDERDWPMPGYDPAGTYHKPEGPGLTDPEVVWRRDLDEPVHREPTLYDGTLFLSGGPIRRLDLDGGAVVRLAPVSAGPPTVVVDTAYRDATLAVPRRTARTVGFLDGLRPSDGLGGRRWRVRSAPIVGRPPQAVVVNGTAYVATTVVSGDVSTGTVLAVDASSGRRTWEATIGRERSESVASRPVVAGGAVYVGGPAGGIHAIERSDGSKRWGRDDVWTTGEAPSWCAPATAPGGPLVAIAPNEIVGLGRDDGDPRWSRPAESGTTYRIDRPAVADETLILGAGADEEERLLAIDLATGERRWSLALAEGRKSTAPVVAGGTVYVADGTRLRGVSLADGRELFVREFDNVVRTPVVGTDRVYVGVWETLYALGASS